MGHGKVRDHTTGGEGKLHRRLATHTDERHCGLQLGYGIMTFPPVHPQYQNMLNNGKGVWTDNSVYVMRGCWEGKIFVTPYDSEEECGSAKKWWCY